MKIATFNINNINKRLANLLAWLRESRPDVACLQELKATDAEFPIAVLERAGDGAVCRGQRNLVWSLQRISWPHPSAATPPAASSLDRKGSSGVSHV